MDTEHVLLFVKYLSCKVENADLTDHEEILLEEKPFSTESCSHCDYHRFGSDGGTPGDVVLDPDFGETHCCDWGGFHVNPYDPQAQDMSPEDAHNYYDSKTPAGYCGGHTGKKPHTQEEINRFIVDRDSLVLRLSGFTDLQKLQSYLESLERMSCS
jgi:hypothetical protein